MLSSPNDESPANVEAAVTNIFPINLHKSLFGTMEWNQKGME